MAFGALASGCVRTASADIAVVATENDSTPAPVAPPTPAPTPVRTPEIDGALLPELSVPTGPRGQLSWTYVDEAAALGFVTTLEAELVFTELQRVTHELDSEELGASTAYRVDGYLSHVPGATSCTAPHASCRVVLLEDADLVGLAIRRDGVLSLDLNWRTFGPDELAARPSAQVVLGLDQIGYLGVAGSLEAAGAVGSTLVLPANGDTARSLNFSRGSAVGHGRLSVDLG
ncbi:MAG: hypothetical protein P8N02_09210 [Actinomycetota bacterium]|nr:hypothetical protein [Actinomycetota bacterium]